MADFRYAADFTFGKEGGFVNHPADRGGPTRYGVTLQTLSIHLGRRATVAEVRNLSISTAKTIYAAFWQGISGERIADDHVAALLFDFAINSGVNGAVQRVQRYAGLDADGVVGPKTLAWLNGDPYAVCGWILAARGRHFMGVLEDPSQQAFNNGWQNRLDACAAEGRKTA